jgi:negative regulator of sigma E activity
MVASGASLIINNGGVMGNIYDNKGVAGAMGDNAVAHDNIFLQDARKVLSEVTLTPADASVVAKLAEALAAEQIEGISLTVRLEGAKHLAALAESAKAGAVLDESLAGWRKWMSNLGERAGAVLSVLANVVTIANPVARLLGLPL